MTSEAGSQCHGKSSQTSVGHRNAKAVASSDLHSHNGASHQSDGHWLIRKAVKGMGEKNNLSNVGILR